MARRRPSVFVEPDIGQAWNAVLHRKGWLAYQWPKEHGGTGWSPVQRYL
jgi:alkylation response protein AidB-like acyl-CoA dehydrogenase